MMCLYHWCRDSLISSVETGRTMLFFDVRGVPYFILQSTGFSLVSMPIDRKKRMLH